MIGALGGGAEATGWVILVNAASYVAVIWQLQRMNVALLHTPELRGRTPGALVEGVRYVRSQPKMMMILVMVFFAGTFGMNFQITSALMATEVFGKGATEYGVLGSAMAVGSLTGALMAARRVRVRLRLLVVAAIALRRGRDRGRPAAVVPRLRALLPGDRVLHADPAQLRQRHHAARVGPGDPRPGDGALHDDRHGRHAARARPSSAGSASTSAPAGPWSSAAC